MSYTEHDLLTINDLRAKLNEDAQYGVYVLNTARIKNNHTSYVEVGMKSPYESDATEAAVNLTIKLTPTESIDINIPPLTIPLDLTMFAPGLSIINTPMFKDRLEKRFLTLITKEAFERVMSTDDAKQVKAYYDRNTTVSAAAGLQESDLLKQINAKSTTIPKAKQATKQQTTLSAVVHEFVDINEDEADHNALFQKYKTVEKKLSDFDLQHLIDNAKVTKIKSASQKELTSRKK